MQRRTLLITVAALVGLAVLATLAGCKDGITPAAVEYYDGAPDFGLMEFQRSRAMAADAPLASPALFDAGRRTADEARLPRIDRKTTSNLVIRNGRVLIEVDSLEPAVALVHELASQLGGYVAGTATQTSRGAIRTASISLKVPAERFDDALTGVRPIGQVESVDVSAEDVSEEYVDVSARMENAHRLERRLGQILANRTGALKDVLEVEQALARVRGEIERYEGRLRYLREHAAMSTLAVNLHEPAPLVGHSGGSVLGAAVEQAWANFVGLAVLIVQALGFVVPLGALAATGWLGVKRFGPAHRSLS